MTGTTTDQETALAEIDSGYGSGGRHLLIGNAGTGKTWLMAEAARRFQNRKLSVIASAPTHKAVAVLKSKLDGSGLFVPCRTIHSLLSLRPKAVTDRQVFERKARAEPVTADVVVVDECSMLGTDLMRHIKRYLPQSFVLFVGDRAQLPPVGEAESESFGTFVKSRLTTIVRQAEGNPILEAAGIVRESQSSGRMDWSWVRSNKRESSGIFLPRDPYAWMQKAFTSREYDDNPDTFRYLAWTNDRVREINTLVRRWRYGENLPTPFMPGERIMLRQPLFGDDEAGDRSIIFNTNEEVDLLNIKRGKLEFEIPEAEGVAGWTAVVPTWELALRRPDDDLEATAHMVADDREWNRIDARIREEAADARQRWRDLHRLREAVVKCQSVYALTAHNSQGSTFGSVFLDLPDIASCAENNILECQRMLYVGLTRPTTAAMVLGA